MVNVFAVPVFFICFRECLETSIIVSVLLAFLKQTVPPDKDPQSYKQLRRQVWWGVIAGLFICLVVGGAMIGCFYTFGADYFAQTEDLWEGIFALIAAVIISIMGFALLRISKLQDKWRVKVARALESKSKDRHINTSRVKHWLEKYAMFILPFITVLREGLEAVVFIGGVSLGISASAFPLAVICGLAAGILVGWLIYRGGNVVSLQICLIISTCFLYLVAAGLLSKGVWYIETNAWNKATGGDAAENGSGPGSYDIRQSVWHVNCCNAELNGGGGWGVFNSLFGWENSATYGSVISYNLYWICVIAAFGLMLFREKRGHWPLMKKPAGSIARGDFDVETAYVSDKKVGGADTTREVQQQESSGSGSDESPTRKEK